MASSESVLKSVAELCGAGAVDTANGDSEGGGSAVAQHLVGEDCMCAR